MYAHTQARTRTHGFRHGFREHTQLDLGEARATSWITMLVLIRNTGLAISSAHRAISSGFSFF